MNNEKITDKQAMKIAIINLASGGMSGRGSKR